MPYRLQNIFYLDYIGVLMFTGTCTIMYKNIKHNEDIVTIFNISCYQLHFGSEDKQMKWVHQRLYKPSTPKQTIKVIKYKLSASLHLRHRKARMQSRSLYKNVK